MKIKLLNVFFCSFFLLCLFFIINISLYLLKQEQAENMFAYCEQNYSEKCYQQVFDVLVPELLVYSAKRNGQELLFAKMSKAPHWHPFLNFETSDGVIFYTELHKNIANYDFEFSKVMMIEFNLDIHHFSNNDSYYDKYSFTEIEKLKEKDKKAIVYYAPKHISEKFVDILLNEYSDTVSGLNLFLDISEQSELFKTVEILKKISDKYVLVSRNSFFIGQHKLNNVSEYYRGDISDGILILSYINKKQLDEYSISYQQDTNKIFRGKKVKYFKVIEKLPQSDIHWVVTITEKFRQILKK